MTSSSPFSGLGSSLSRVVLTPGGKKPTLEKGGVSGRPIFIFGPDDLSSDRGAGKRRVCVPPLHKPPIMALSHYTENVTWKT